MNHDIKIEDQFLAPLFDELYAVKEKDFSIEYNPLGSGNHKLLLLVDYSGDGFLDETQMQLLKTIVDKGLRKSMEDVWLLNINQSKNTDLNQLIEFFKPFQIIIWGCESWMSRQGLQIELHQQKMISGVEFLRAEALTKYINDVPLKGKLWGSLQRMFFN